MSSIIEIEHLHKSFGCIHAVNDLSFSVEEGSLFAFLGLNGAGKSTTISIMCGQLPADSGSVRIGGRALADDPDSIRRSLGVVFQNSVLDAPLTLKDNLTCRAALYGITGNALKERLDELSELLDLSQLLSHPVGKMSGGQRRRADIARALIHDPKILVLDEPTTGLDPQTRKMLWNTVESLRRERNMTVFLTTHYMEEAADADRVIILDSGSIAAEGSPLELKNRFSGDFLSIYDREEGEIASLGLAYTTIPDGYRISLVDTRQATRLISEHPELFTDYELVKGKMDDIFLAVTGRSLHENGNVDQKKGGKRN